MFTLALFVSAVMFLSSAKHTAMCSDDGIMNGSGK